MGSQLCGRLAVDTDWQNYLEQWLAPYLDALGNKTRRRMCPAYVAGLIGPGDRKSIQPMAARVDTVSYVAGCAAIVSLAARTPDHLRRRQQLCRPRTGPCHHASGNADQSTAVGCQPVCTACETNITHDGAARAKRTRAAETQDPAVQPSDDLDKNHCLHLVWPSRWQNP
ncbi:MAG: transposase [Negativicutes bacterium]|nr:transposase [Negativicutes bacterium]